MCSSLPEMEQQAAFAEQPREMRQRAGCICSAATGIEVLRQPHVLK